MATFLNEILMENDVELNELCEFFQRLNRENSLECCPSSSKRRLPEWQLSKIYSQDFNGLDRFLHATGGICGGWNESLHQHFVYLRSKHNLSSVIFIFRQNFPEITEQEILEHDKWYTKYLKLKCDQRKINRLYKIQDMKNELNADLRSVTSVKVIPKRDDNTKNEIKLWKEWKKKMDEERRKKKEVDAEIQRKIDQTKWFHHFQKKKIISEIRIKKFEEMRVAKEIKNNNELQERRIRSRTANKMLAIYRQKDKAWLQDKQMKKEAAQQAVQERLNNLHSAILKFNSRINVYKDPCRLLVPTVEWKQKMRKIGHTDPLPDTMEEEKSKTVHIANVQHLAVPEWREEMNKLRESD